MFFTGVTILFFILQSLLILTTKFTFWPEIVTFSWMVNKGMIPYRDFFDHHGFLMYYLLSPLMDNGFILLKIFYLLIQSLNLFFVLLILRKASNRLGLVMGGILYVFIGYFVSENVLWYEIVITTFLLGSYYLMNRENNINLLNFIIGIMITLASFIKPTAGIFIIPVIFFRKSIIPLVIYMLSWLWVFVIYFSNKGSLNLLDNLFFFNHYFATNYRNSYYSDWKFHVSVILIILFCVFAYWKKGKIKEILKPLSFILFSAVFFFYLYNKWHLLPLMSFFVILIGQILNLKHFKFRNLFVALLVAYCLILGRKTAMQQNILNKTTPWQDNKRNSEIIGYLKQNKLEKERLYVFGNQGELYYLLGQIPPTYFVLQFPLLSKYYPGMENRIVKEMEKNNVRTVIVTLPKDKEFISLTTIDNKILSDFFPVKKTAGYIIYRSRETIAKSL